MTEQKVKLAIEPGLSMKENNLEIIETKNMAGYCYTQLTDVEQEQNGIYNYDRSKKFDMSRIKKIFSKQPKSYLQ